MLLGCLQGPALFCRGWRCGSQGRKADEGAKATEIDLLHSITGAFRPGVLTALMVCAGAVMRCRHSAALLARHRPRLLLRLCEPGCASRCPWVRLPVLAAGIEHCSTGLQLFVWVTPPMGHRTMSNSALFCMQGATGAGKTTL